MLRIKEIITYLDEKNVNYSFHGNLESQIESFCPLNMLRNSCITWVRDINNYDISEFIAYENLLIISNTAKANSTPNVNYIITDNPHSIFFSILNEFFIEQQVINTYNNSVVETKNIGTNVKIGQFCYIGPEVVIEDNVIIKNNVSIEGRVKIGKNTLIYSGVVIGMDGYAYYEDVNGNNARVPHLGGVLIGKNVEIGSNTCIAKGCLGDTIICDDVKIDNLCHIAHNVVIGKRSKIIALSMLAGSSIIGEDVWVAPCSAIKNQVTIGNNSLVGMGAVVTKDVVDNTVVAGVPAKLLRNK
jgi:UDP-3-O-[3-hydroxymyristoyl] glucosamine N-acyltransferase